MAKLNREKKLRERRLDKQARKDARKQGEMAGVDTEALDAEEKARLEEQEARLDALGAARAEHAGI